MEKEEARRWVRGIVWLSWALWSGVVSKTTTLVESRVG